MGRSCPLYVCLPKAAPDPAFGGYIFGCFRSQASSTQVVGRMCLTASTRQTRINRSERAWMQLVNPRNETPQRCQKQGLSAQPRPKGKDGVLGESRQTLSESFPLQQLVWMPCQCLMGTTTVCSVRCCATSVDSNRDPAVLPELVTRSKHPTMSLSDSCFFALNLTNTAKLFRKTLWGPRRTRNFSSLALTCLGLPRIRLISFDKDLHAFQSLCDYM